MQIFNLFPAAIVLFTLFGAEASWGQAALPVDPNKTWRVLETEHFEVIYDKNEKAQALDFADQAERANILLQPLLTVPPRTKITLVIADITDDSNGSASAIPYPNIEIYPVLPSVFDPTSEYYNWTREVVQHEYTHILNFEPVHGFMKVLRFVFGSIITPGGYLPRWYTEGLAVEMESRLTPVGRGRSHYYSALVRSMVEGGVWGSETIDRLGATSIPTWPRGQRPYTYGYFLMHHLSELPVVDPSIKNETPEQIYGLLDHRMGSRVPWLINGPAEDYFGSDWSGLLDLTYKDLQAKAETQLKTLKDAGAADGKPLKQSGYMNFGAQVSPDHLKLAAIVTDINDSPGIRVWTRQTVTEPFALVTDDKDHKMPDPIIKGRAIHQLSWRPDSRHLVYDHSDTYHHYDTFNDLYEIDIEKKDEKQLTHGMRAREATTLADGTLVFIVATSRKTELVRSNSEGKNAKIILNPKDGERVSSPRPFLDGVIYSHRDAKGKEWIEYLSLKTNKFQALTHAAKTGEIHMIPQPDPVDPNAFYYASSVSGVMNIYHYAKGHSDPVTNSTTYSFSPAVDQTANQIIYSRLTAQGFILEAGSLGQKETPATIPSMQTYPPADEGDAAKAKIFDEHAYHGVSYLFPQYWIPFLYLVPGGVIIDASSGSSDPLNHHQYAFDIGYDSRVNLPWEDFSYTNASLPFFIDTAFANQYAYLEGAGISEHLIFGYLDTRHFIGSDTNKWTVGPEIQYRETDYSPFLFTQMGPGVSLSYNGVAPVRDYQISPEGGASFDLGYDYYLPGWGNTSFPNIHGDAAVYLSGWLLPKHHVISLKAQGWVSPPQPTILTGAVQAGGEIFASLLPPGFLVRGYPFGEFIGYSTYVGNFEYRFPLSYPFSGPGTFPLFFNKLSLALIFDAITLQGGYYDNSTNPANLLVSNLGTFYCGTGAELRLDTQIFYGIPITARIGLYDGLTTHAFGGFDYMFSLGTIQ